MQGLVIVCQRRELDTLLDAMEDWKEQGTITVYGSTPKEHDGFIVMHWTEAIPTAFQEMQLKADPGIIDYLVYDVPVLLTNTTTM